MRFLAEQAKLHPDVAGTWFQMAIDHREAGVIVGDCGLKAIEGQPGQVEIGFTLSPDHQGKGYATEALTRLLDYIFGELRKHRVTAVTDARNAPAVRLLERVRMRREGHFIQNIWFKGSWGDEYLYALLAQEWSQLGWGAPQKLVQPKWESPGKVSPGGTHEKAKERRRGRAIAP